MKYSIDGDTLTDLADAIREKSLCANAITPTQMIGEIENLYGKGDCYVARWTPEENVSDLHVDLPFEAGFFAVVNYAPYAQSTPNASLAVIADCDAYRIGSTRSAYLFYTGGSGGVNLSTIGASSYADCFSISSTGVTFTSPKQDAKFLSSTTYIVVAAKRTYFGGESDA